MPDWSCHYMHWLETVSGDHMMSDWCCHYMHWLESERWSHDVWLELSLHALTRDSERWSHDGWLGLSLHAPTRDSERWSHDAWLGLSFFPDIRSPSATSSTTTASRRQTPTATTLPQRSFAMSCWKTTVGATWTSTSALGERGTMDWLTWVLRRPSFCGWTVE